MERTLDIDTGFVDIIRPTAVGIKLHTSYIVVGGPNPDTKKSIPICISRSSLLVLLKLQDTVLVTYTLPYYKLYI